MRWVRYCSFVRHDYSAKSTRCRRSFSVRQGQPSRESPDSTTGRQPVRPQVVNSRSAHDLLPFALKSSRPSSRRCFRSLEVALLASVAGLANAMILSVIERKQEFGLRRALGARPKPIVGLVLAESTIVGAVGGAVGLGGGLLGIIVVTVLRHWARLRPPVGTRRYRRRNCCRRYWRHPGLGARVAHPIRTKRSDVTA